MSKLWWKVLAVVVACAVCVSYASAQEKKGKREGGKHPTVEERFNKLDTNGDKKLSFDEFKAGPFGKKGGDPARLEKLFKKIAGDDEFITLEEFKDFMKQMAERAKKEKGKEPEKKG